MENPLLRDTAIIFLLSIGTLLLCLRLRLPKILGFFIAGTVMGPSGLRLVTNVEEVKVLSEVGVVLLLFSIGLEFSFGELMRIRREAVVGGTLQILLTALAAFLVLRAIGLTPRQAIFGGLLTTLSSTAIVMRLFQQRGEVNSPHGRTSLAILLFQDLAVVPMMLLTPALAGGEHESVSSTLAKIAKAAAIVILAPLFARRVVPRLLHVVARSRSHEAFLFTIFGIGLGVAWLTSWAGLSLALGAFLAGLVISESEYSHQALGDVLPFRDIFSSFFFVSIGMLVDVQFFASHAGSILGLTGLMFLLKGVLIACAVLILGFPPRTAIISGLALAQIGEFSFILAEGGVEAGLLTADMYQTFLAVSVLSLAATPFAMALSSRIPDFHLNLPWLKGLTADETCGDTTHPPLTDHLIIVGFGVNGRNVAHAARMCDIPHLILETNPDTVRRERERGTPITYGDAGAQAIILGAGVERARILVVAISDPAATQRVVALARQHNPRLHIIARTRFLAEIQPLLRLGADEVIPEEFETSIEIFSRVLRHYLIPQEDIRKFSAEIRQSAYAALRDPGVEAQVFPNLKLHLPDIDIVTLRVGTGSALEGKMLGESELRQRHGVTILAVGRQGELQPSPDKGHRFSAGEIAIIFGRAADLSKVAGLFAENERSG